MKKAVNQGTTLFVVSGTNKTNAKLEPLFISQKRLVNTEENEYYTKSVGTEKVSISQEDIANMQGVSKFFAMCGPLQRTLHKYEQGVDVIIKPHTVVFDRNGKSYDLQANVDIETHARFFTERKKANKYFKKLMARSKIVFIDESHSFFSRNGQLPNYDAFANSNYNMDFFKDPKTFYGEDIKNEE